MRQILMLIGQSLLHRMVSPAISGGTAGILEPVKEYVEESVRRYAVVAAAAFLFSLYFVAGTLIMITAAAESFDAFGFFAPGTFFYSGVALTIISAAALGGCYARLRRGRKKPPETLPEVLPSAPALPEPRFAHLAEAVITGIISGLISRRVSRPEPGSPRVRRVI